MSNTDNIQTGNVPVTLVRHKKNGRTPRFPEQNPANASVVNSFLNDTAPSSDVPAPIVLTPMGYSPTATVVTAAAPTPTMIATEPAPTMTATAPVPAYKAPEAPVTDTPVQTYNPAPAPTYAAAAPVHAAPAPVSPPVSVYHPPRPTTTTLVAYGEPQTNVIVKAGPNVRDAVTSVLSIDDTPYLRAEKIQAMADAAKAHARLHQLGVMNNSFLLTNEPIFVDATQGIPRDQHGIPVFGPTVAGELPPAEQPIVVEELAAVDTVPVTAEKPRIKTRIALTIFAAVTVMAAVAVTVYFFVL